MNNNLEKAFDAVKAEENLKERTLDYLKKQNLQAAQNKCEDTSVLQQEKKQSQMRGLRNISVAFYCLLLLVIGVGGYTTYFTETAYISIDVNPSLELGINRFDRVVSVESYNEDGAVVKFAINIKNKKYEDAIDILLGEQGLRSYIDEDSPVTFTVATEDTREKYQILYRLESCANHAQVKSHCGEAETTLINEAHQNGFSFGKYKAYLEMKSCDSNVTEEECKDMTMSEIRQRIQSCTSHGSSQGTGHGGGYRHGHGSGHDE